MENGVIEGASGVRWFEKKIWGEYFDPVEEGKKKYELRLGDFACREGDMLVLREWEPGISGYTGRVVVKRVTYAKRFTSGVCRGYRWSDKEHKNIRRVIKYRL